MSPVAPGPAVKTLKIDGRDVSAHEDQNLLEVIREHDIELPTLCYLKGLSAIGACRLCLVEVKGRPRLAAACVTKVEEGMEITTNSERLKKYRQMIVELLFAERNHICSVCVSNGHCELQDMAKTLGISHIRFPYRYPTWPVDATSRRYVSDPNRCILCTRCVRACDEIEGAHTKDVKGRGIDSCIISDLDDPWGSSETCTECGKCVNCCPTGALVEKGKAVAEMEKRKQFLPYLTLRRELHDHE